MSLMLCCHHVKTMMLIKIHTRTQWIHPYCHIAKKANQQQKTQIERPPIFSILKACGLQGLNSLNLFLWR